MADAADDEVMADLRRHIAQARWRWAAGTDGMRLADLAEKAADELVALRRERAEADAPTLGDAQARFLVKRVRGAVGLPVPRFGRAAPPAAPLVPPGVPWPADAEGRARRPAEMHPGERVELAARLLDAEADVAVPGERRRDAWALLRVAFSFEDHWDVDAVLAALGQGRPGAGEGGG